MKPSQWITVLILALMVGGITFVTVYLGSGAAERVEALPTETTASLTFSNKIFPREGERPQITEVREKGHQDYWFVNESGMEAIVGLEAKGCTCSEVEITVAPASWVSHLTRLAVTQVLALPPLRLADSLRLADLTTLAAISEGGASLPVLPDNEAGTMLTKENSVRVPAGAVGRVRLSWKQQQAKVLATYAELWMSAGGPRVNARLEANVLISTPLELDRDVSIPAVYETELFNMPEGQRGYIYCWSLTRTAFPLEATLVREHLKPESDALEVGKPIPLQEEDLLQLQQRDTRMQKFPVKSGYRIPITVRAKAPDGTPIEWGEYSRHVVLHTSSDFEPVTVRVSGAVLGDIIVGGGKGGGALNLGPFPRRRGVVGNKPNNSITLQTDEEDVELELDRSRVPEYLNPSLSKPQQSRNGHRQWVLRVEVPPNEVRGTFPRDDDPVYRDSAIYVKTKVGNSTKSSHKIRIPVLGVANDG